MHYYPSNNNNNNGHSTRYNNNRQPIHNIQRQPTYPANHQIVDLRQNDLAAKANKRKSVRHVELTKGNLILDCPVPDKILRNVQYTTGEEFTSMRYTAVTCDPNDYIKNNYYLRPYIYGRKTEIMIVMTMYNEDDQLFIKTMSSAIKNVAHLCSRDRSKVWGSEGWKKIVVVVVADGRNKINKRVLKVLGAMGVYQDNIMQDSVAGKPVTGHLFEYTSQLLVDSEFNIHGSNKKLPPVQVLFCLKEKNAKKLNSHRWFFNSFAAQLNPNVCILLDVGTKPSHTSVYHLWKAELGTGWKNLINPLVASQNFEYKMSNILDKPLESVFGYISVLPGAFSAYRYKALLNTSPGKGPLASYFKVPDKILRNVQYTTGEEFTSMRYTAVTCDPNDYIKNNYYLRPYIYGRKTEIMIVMTMYNEDDQLFIKTMSSAIKNVAHLCSRDRSKVWGSEGWKKIVVVVVADGRNKINKRVLKVLGAMGVYQDNIMQDSVAGKPVTGHLFEYTSQLLVDSEFNIHGSNKKLPPVQVLFCLKEKNAKKLNSHRWFFNSFAAQLNPNVCILLDVGTKPSHTSVYHLWKAELGTGWKNLINPLVASQNFEYKMSNILDKPLESVFGYISVLPGAFSAYRYKALLNTSPGKGPLASYFKGEAMHGAGDAGIFEANMYLAEDRILCFELVAKKHEGWKLKYVKSAKAETDVPDSVPEFISQRRRWLNGSFFAAFYSIAHFTRIWSSGQPIHRKFLLQIEFIYNAINLVFNWFALGNFYLSFFFLTSAVTADPATDPFRGFGDELFDIVRSLYIMVIVTIFISSMGNRPQGSKLIYTLCIVLFALIMATMLYCAGYTVYLSVIKDNTINFKKLQSIKEALSKAAFRDIVISLASTYGLYFFSSFIHGEPWHMITCLVQYILLVPFYVNILMVYAFCNTHDVSWGTKGDNGTSGDLAVAQPVAGKDGKKLLQVEVPTERKDINAAYDHLISDLKVKVREEKQHRDAATKKEDFYKLFRTNLVLVWMFTNGSLIVFFTSNTWKNYVAEKNINGAYNPYLTFVFWSVAGLSAFRTFGTVWYLIHRAIFG
ncbi:15009_t:CDS:2 [Entrophospora sp. SA101]|nr:15009_t:CDS:2 [Entrophospora sp. SA101]